jgi:hypothetical protein
MQVSEKGDFDWTLASCAAVGQKTGSHWTQVAMPVLERNQLRRNGWRVFCDLGQPVPRRQNALPCSFQSANTTEAPDPTKTLAVARPSPDPAPVTSATLFSLEPRRLPLGRFHAERSFGLPMAEKSGRGVLPYLTIERIEKNKCLVERRTAQDR